VSSSLLRRVAEGDSSAVRECLDRFGDVVWTLARRASPSASDAEDAVQEIFLDLWKSAHRYDPAIASETTFVAMIARRRLIDRRRSSQRRPRTEPLPETSEVPADDPAPAELCMEAALAAKAVAQLRPEHRQMLLLSTCHGLSHQEIADSTGVPLGTVKAHVRRALLHVRAALTGDPAPEDSL
jgi:RNA polymerase sigma-70 factor (ECF subfamily)